MGWVTNKTGRQFVGTPTAADYAAATSRADVVSLNAARSSNHNVIPDANNPSGYYVRGNYTPTADDLAYVAAGQKWLPETFGKPADSGGVIGSFVHDTIEPTLKPALYAAGSAALATGAGLAATGALGAGAGATAGAEGIAAGQAAGLTTDQLLAQSVAGLSVATPAETAAALGAGDVVAAGAGAGAVAADAAGGTQFGGTVQSAAAADAGATGGGSTGALHTAAGYLSTAKDVAGLALTGLGLAAATGMVSPGAAQAPPEPTAPPQDQVSSVDQQGVSQADDAGQRFPNLGGSGDDTLFNGASGIDPFMLNLGRAKLLGQ